jgi:predicted nucleotidyltransferase
MRRDESVARLGRHVSELKQPGVEHLYLFGSTARDEQDEEDP